ncbi:hypothetical protein HAX54_040852 [Datura stramonium]|uniref:Uncharacterized protein n=1 Tax=Datura stramonium TaxID=4076 RepID=A0ABS8SKE6_DATST|nr:hypothetical protein [Datura stramonium]
MCDTSYRHSNCFDQFKKSFEEASASTAQQVGIPASASIAESTAAISEALSELPGERTEGGSISLEADPERQRSWRRLERQRDLGDLLSTLQSSVAEEGSESTSLTFDEGGLLTVFLFVRILQPRSNSRSSSWSGSSRTRAQATAETNSVKTLSRPMKGKLILEMMKMSSPMEGQVVPGGACVDNQHQKISSGRKLVFACYPLECYRCR